MAATETNKKLVSHFWTAALEFHYIHLNYESVRDLIEQHTVVNEFVDRENENIPRLLFEYPSISAIRARFDQMLAGRPARHDISPEDATSAEFEADLEILAWVDAAEAEQSALLQEDRAVQTKIPEADLVAKPLAERGIDSDEEGERHKAQMQMSVEEEYVDAAEEMSKARTEDWASVQELDMDVEKDFGDWNLYEKNKSHNPVPSAPPTEREIEEVKGDEAALDALLADEVDYDPDDITTVVSMELALGQQTCASLRAGQPIYIAFDTELMMQMGLRLFVTKEAIVSPDWVPNLAIMFAYNQRIGQHIWTNRVYSASRNEYYDVIRDFDADNEAQYEISQSWHMAIRVGPECQSCDPELAAKSCVDAPYEAQNS